MSSEYGSPPLVEIIPPEDLTSYPVPIGQQATDGIGVRPNRAGTQAVDSSQGATYSTYNLGIYDQGMYL